MRFALLFVVIAFAAAAAHAQDTIRCNGALISVGMVEAEVIARCGEPKTRDVEEVPIRARRPNGTTYVVGTARVERWTYDRGPGRFPAVLTFEEGKLKRIELITRP